MHKFLIKIHETLNGRTSKTVDISNDDNNDNNNPDDDDDGDDDNGGESDTNVRCLMASFDGGTRLQKCK